MSNWYIYRAYNSQTLVGYSDRHDRAVIADAACDRLNKGREVNLYAYEVLPGDAETTNETVRRVYEGGGWLFSGDTTLDDVTEG